MITECRAAVRVNFEFVMVCSLKIKNVLLESSKKKKTNEPERQMQIYMYKQTS